MRLRRPDYFKEFHCIADQCKDSCCIGWEIDIDEDTCEKYRQWCATHPDDPKESVAGRIRKYLYKTQEGDFSFALAKAGRCPFLNDRNLCDIYTEMGEDALSEVCTEYPRFAIEYGDVLQKCMSLSCEEVGRLLFTRESSVTFCEEGEEEPELWEENDPEEDIPEENDPEAEFSKKSASCKEDQDEGGEFHAQALRLEAMQKEAIRILQNRAKSIEERMKEYLFFLTGDPECADIFPSERLIGEEMEDMPADDAEDMPAGEDAEDMPFGEDAEDMPAGEDAEEILSSYDMFLQRLSPFLEMETLDFEWRNVKKAFEQKFSEESYQPMMEAYLSSPDYRENDYEQLMVYFTFRYFMNAVFDFDVSSYAKLALVFTLVIRDMDALRFADNGGHFTLTDRIDTVRIFSKEVEHSPDNVELAREAFLFDEIFETEMLLKQI